MIRNRLKTLSLLAGRESCVVVCDRFVEIDRLAAIDAFAVCGTLAESDRFAASHKSVVERHDTNVAGCSVATGFVDDGCVDIGQHSRARSATEIRFRARQKAACSFRGTGRMSD